MSALGWLLLPLGQLALYAYTAHIVVVSVVALAVARAPKEAPAEKWW